MKSSRLDALKFKYTRCNRMNISYYWSLKITFKAVLQKNKYSLDLLPPKPEIKFTSKKMFSKDKL